MTNSQNIQYNYNKSHWILTGALQTPVTTLIKSNIKTYLTIESDIDELLETQYFDYCFYGVREKQLIDESPDYHILRDQLCMKCYDLKDILIYVFDLDQPTYFNFSADYTKFLNGQYSQLSHKLKAYIIKNFGDIQIAEDNIKRLHPIVNVLFPNCIDRKKLADVLDVDASLIKEVWDKPDLEQETFRYYTKGFEAQHNT